MRVNDMNNLKGLLIGLFLLGLILYIISGKMKYKASKYEFENRTGGGVVEFDSFESANKHQNKGCFAQLLGVLGMLLMGGSGVLLALIFAMEGN